MMHKEGHRRSKHLIKSHSASRNWMSPDNRHNTLGANKGSGKVIGSEKSIKEKGLKSIR